MEEKLLFQYIMSYKAYRRIMIITRVIFAVLIAGGVAVVGMWNLVLGIMLPIIVLFFGAIAIVMSLQHEETYMVFGDRVVIKNREKRKVISTENIKSVSYRRAFYEKDLATGTVKIRAIDDGRVKTYKLKHIFDAKPLVDFIEEIAKKNSGEIPTDDESV